MRIARFILRSQAGSLLQLLDEIGGAHPGLSFDDFWGGFVLSDTLVNAPQQIRPVAKGLPEVGDDPIRWIDEVLAIASPANKWGRA